MGRRASGRAMAALVALVAASLAAGPGTPPVRADVLTIDHDPVGCLVAGLFPRFDACFAPASDLARARVLFRAKGTPHWYSVDMSAPGGCRSVLLPKPLPTTPAVEYYVSAVGSKFAEARTRDHSARVVAREGDCGRDVLVAAGTGAAVVLLGVVAGAPAVPPGFSAEGIVGAPSGGGGSAQESGGGGGGGGAAVGIILGIGALGAGGYLLYKELGSDEEAEGEPSSPFDGQWQGLTSQDRPVSLTVAGSALTAFQSSVNLGSANAPAVVPIQRAFAPGLALPRGAFSFPHGTDPPLTVTGTLNASGTAEGRIEIGGRLVATWNATRR